MKNLFTIIIVLAALNLILNQSLNLIIKRYLMTKGMINQYGIQRMKTDLSSHGDCPLKWKR